MSEYKTNGAQARKPGRGLLSVQACRWAAYRFGAGNRNVHARPRADARATRPACSRRTRHKVRRDLPDTEAPAKPDGVAPAARTGTAPASASPAHDVETKDAKYYLERGILAYRSGDLYVALANFDLAIDRDPNLSESYINRGIVFHRLGDLKRAFSDVAKAQRIDDLNQKKSASGARTLEPYRL